MDGNISYYPSIIGSLGLGDYNPRISTTQVGFHEYASKVKEFAGPNVGYIDVYRKPTGLYEVIL